VRKTPRIVASAAMEKEFPNHKFEVRNVPDQGLLLLLLPSPEDGYTEAIQWYAIGYKDGDENRK
jgi:hypothetical protein